MEQAVEARPRFGGRVKFIIGGLLIIAAIAYLIISSTKANAEYFFTIDELQSRGQSVVGQNVRISGAVIGDSIQYDPQALSLNFTIANVPADNKQIEAQGGLAAVLHVAVTDPSRTRMQVVYLGPKPDLLRDEAQAIMTGHLGEDNIFHADELLLKCPTKYEEAVPSQVAP
ncbi:MAG: cytochrome c maturation protein CcmE [Anaerolineales bacterium]|jgi:cytochrome c-type biogenesis protein CcmE